mgnify:CR=1 FL=1
MTKEVFPIYYASLTEKIRYRAKLRQRTVRTQLVGAARSRRPRIFTAGGKSSVFPQQLWKNCDGEIPLYNGVIFFAPQGFDKIRGYDFVRDCCEIMRQFIVECHIYFIFVYGLICLL